MMNTQLQVPRLHPSRRLDRSKAGFSLAELMVVIVIIGLLATLVVPQVVSSLGRAFGGKVKSDLMALDNALREYAINNSMQYPDDLSELITPDENGHTYLKQKKIPTDPWGMEYMYDPPIPGTPDPRVYTLGKDGAPGGEAENEDLSNIKLLGGEDQ
jgi:general secretion pathway protein G